MIIDSTSVTFKSEKSVDVNSCAAQQAHGTGQQAGGARARGERRAVRPRARPAHEHEQLAHTFGDF